MEKLKNPDFLSIARLLPPPDTPSGPPILKSARTPARSAGAETADVSAPVSVIRVFPAGQTPSQATHEFDAVVTPSMSQEGLYDIAASDICGRIIGGEDVNLVAAGPQMSGKTFTIMGPKRIFLDPKQSQQIFQHINYQYSSYRAPGASPVVKSAPTGISSSAGLLPRLVADLFGRIYAAPASAAFAVNVSCVELHEEKLVDLMLPAPLSDTKARPKIQVLRKPVDGLSLNAARSMAVTSAEELWTVIQDAFVRRSMVAEGDNKGNARSSFFVFIVVQLFDELRNTSSCGTLTVVDMADIHPEPAPKAPALCLRAPRQLITCAADCANDSTIRITPSKATQLLRGSFADGIHTVWICCLPTHAGAEAGLDTTLELATHLHHASKGVKQEPERRTSPPAVSPTASTPLPSTSPSARRSVSFKTHEPLLLQEPSAAGGGERRSSSPTDPSTDAGPSQRRPEESPSPDISEEVAFDFSAQSLDMALDADDAARPEPAARSSPAAVSTSPTRPAKAPGGGSSPHVDTRQQRRSASHSSGSAQDGKPLVGDSQETAVYTPGHQSKGDSRELDDAGDGSDDLDGGEADDGRDGCDSTASTPQSKLAAVLKSRSPRHPGQQDMGAAQHADDGDDDDADADADADVLKKKPQAGSDPSHSPRGENQLVPTGEGRSRSKSPSSKRSPRRTRSKSPRKRSHSRHSKGKQSPRGSQHGSALGSGPLSAVEMHITPDTVDLLSPEMRKQIGMVDGSAGVTSADVIPSVQTQPSPARVAGPTPSARRTPGRRFFSPVTGKLTSRSASTPPTKRSASSRHAAHPGNSTSPESTTGHPPAGVTNDPGAALERAAAEANVNDAAALGLSNSDLYSSRGLRGKTVLVSPVGFSATGPDGRQWKPWYQLQQGAIAEGQDVVPVVVATEVKRTDQAGNTVVAQPTPFVLNWKYDDKSGPWISMRSPAQYQTLLERAKTVAQTAQERQRELQQEVAALYKSNVSFEKQLSRLFEQNQRLTEELSTVERSHDTLLEQGSVQQADLTRNLRDLQRHVRRLEAERRVLLRSAQLEEDQLAEQVHRLEDSQQDAPHSTVLSTDSGVGNMTSGELREALAREKGRADQLEEMHRVLLDRYTASEMAKAEAEATCAKQDRTIQVLDEQLQKLKQYFEQGNGAPGPNSDQHQQFNSTDPLGVTPEPRRVAPRPSPVRTQASYEDALAHRSVSARSFDARRHGQLKLDDSRPTDYNMIDDGFDPDSELGAGYEDAGSAASELGGPAESELRTVTSSVLDDFVKDSAAALREREQQQRGVQTATMSQLDGGEKNLLRAEVKITDSNGDRVVRASSVRPMNRPSQKYAFHDEVTASSQGHLTHAAKQRGGRARAGSQQADIDPLDSDEVDRYEPHHSTTARRQRRQASQRYRPPPSERARNTSNRSSSAERYDPARHAMGRQASSDSFQPSAYASSSMASMRSWRPLQSGVSLTNSMNGMSSLHKGGYQSEAQMYAAFPRRMRDQLAHVPTNTGPLLVGSSAHDAALAGAQRALMDYGAHSSNGRSASDLTRRRSSEASLLPDAPRGRSGIPARGSRQNAVTPRFIDI